MYLFLWGEVNLMSYTYSNVTETNKQTATTKVRKKNALYKNDKSFAYNNNNNNNTADP